MFQKDVSEVVDDLAERDQYAFVSSGLHFSSSSIGAIGVMQALMYLLLKQCADLPCHFPGYFFPFGVAAVIVLIILQLLYITCVFSCRRPLGLFFSKGGRGDLCVQRF